MNNQKKIFLTGPMLIAIAAILWALDGILRVSLYALLPIIIVFYEHLIGSAIFIPHIIKARSAIKLSRRDLGILMLVALLSGVLGTLWFTKALQMVEFIPFSVVMLLQKLQPIFAISTAALILKEKITREYILWAGLAIIAAFFVTFPNGAVSIAKNPETLYGAILAVGAAFAWGSSTALSKLLLKNNSATNITGLRFIFATIFAFLIIVLTRTISELSTPNASQILRLFIIVFSTGMVALWIYYKGLKNTQAKVSTIVELIFPMLAVLIDIFLYKSVLAPSQYIAGIFLVFSIIKVSSFNNKK